MSSPTLVQPPLLLEDETCPFGNEIRPPRHVRRDSCTDFSGAPSSHDTEEAFEAHLVDELPQSGRLTAAIATGMAT